MEAQFPSHGKRHNRTSADETKTGEFYFGTNKQRPMRLPLPRRMAHLRVN